MNARKLSVIIVLLLCFFANAEVFHITEGSASGYTMTDGNTYVIENSVSFTNSVAGGNGITIADGATVVIYVPTNVTLTAIGANSDGQIGGGAGIRVPASSTLVITGEGIVSAKGGNAGNGGNGANGQNGVSVSASTSSNGHASGTSGKGGNGGNGGGGAGCCIGGNGGTGGTGGLGGTAVSVSDKYYWVEHIGTAAESGNAGTNGGSGESSGSMGNVFVIGKIRLNLVCIEATTKGGQSGSAGIKKEYERYQNSGPSVAYGGGGGAGGGAGATSDYEIGAGGQSGGGGGGGGSGGLCFWKNIYDITGFGGYPGKSSVSYGENGAGGGTCAYASGGASGHGGSQGIKGEDGMLYLAPTVDSYTKRSSIQAITHTAAQYTITLNTDNAPVSPMNNNTLTATLGSTLPPIEYFSPKDGIRFFGWSTEPDGGNYYYDSHGNPLVSSYTNTTSITLYAQWKVGENYSILNGEIPYLWQVNYTKENIGGYELSSATIPDGTNSWMSTTVTGPGKLSFDWKVSCENRYAYLQVLIDGTQKKRISGTKDWESLEYEIASGEHTIKWNYVKDGADVVGDDAGYVRNISWRPYLSYSSMTEYGTSLPADSIDYLYGDTIDASVNESVTDGNVRYDCIGWTGTGSAPETGTSNTVSFVLKANSSIAWNWQTNYWTELSVTGPASTAFVDEWIVSGAGMTVPISPTVPYYSFALSGDTDGVTIDGTNLVFTANQARSISLAVTELTLESALDAVGASWRTDGDANWFPQDSTTHDGIDAAQSGVIDGKGESAIEATFIGPGALSFQWKLVTGGANSGIDLLVDGDVVDGLTDDTDWSAHELNIEEGRHVVRWEFWCADGGASAFLDEVAWTGTYPAPYQTSVTVVGPATADFSEGLLPDAMAKTVTVTPSVPYYTIALSGDTDGVTLDGTTLSFVADQARAIVVTVTELTFDNVLESTDLVWWTGGNANWFPQAEESYDGADAAQSGVVTGKGSTWLSTTVTGPGTLTFRWKLATDGLSAGIDLLVDGDYADGLTDDTDWTECTCEIESGDHEVSLEFWRPAGVDGGTAWLDQVTWNGSYPFTKTTPEPVPYKWLDMNAKSFLSKFDYDFESTAFDTAANGINKVWECYVAGLRPTVATDVFRTVISLTDGQPQISWDPRLTAEEEAKRNYTISGRESLTTGSWTSPTNSTHRFFRVNVEMK